MPTRALPAVFVLLLFVAIGAHAQTGIAQLPWKVQEIEKGLVWKQVHTEALFGGWQHLNLLEINPKKRKLSLAFVTDSLVATSSMAARESALAAVNAGFFNMQKGGSVSLLKVDGNIVNASDPKHVADKSFILKGALVLGPGKRVRVESAQADSSYFPRKYPSVLLTGPMLLENGAEVALAKTPFNDNRHPRTCVCITDERQVLLLTADGRNAQALGLSLPELRTLLAELGCRDAVNLDGGGSTTMWIFGQPDKGIVNMPSDNKLFDHFGERKVANAVLIH
jgi:exopolysaccharide biosynthesis protein